MNLSFCVGDCFHFTVKGHENPTVKYNLNNVALDEGIGGYLSIFKKFVNLIYILHDDICHLLLFSPVKLFFFVFSVITLAQMDLMWHVGVDILILVKLIFK